MSPVAVHLHAPTLRCAWGPSRRGLVDALLIPSIVTQCNVRLINRLQ